jgi:F-type H+-transporting ATPase subunit delta
MTSPAVASRYANALADVVLDPKSQSKPEQVLAALRTFAALLDGSPELQNALASPSVALARKRAVVGKLADALAMATIERNFLYVLISHRRINALDAMVDSFEVVLDERLGFSRGDITSAQELNGGQRAQLEAELARLTGRRMRLRFTTDPGLIGGVVARIGSTVYDGSVKGRLESMARQLNAE